MKHDGIAGKTVVITGASSGFGNGMARKFAEAGANVVLAARRSELIDSIAAECKEMETGALAIETDVTRQSDVDRLCETAITRFGRIDVWINNAGAAALGRFEDVPIEDHIQVIATNLHGVIYGCHVALRHFIQHNDGMIINIASALGKIPAPYYASYVAAKHGVVGLGGSLRQELRENKKHDIHVCTVMPNSNDTPFFDHVANYTGHEPKPIPPLYDPQEVIDTVFGLVEKPEDEVVVGGIGKAMVGMHQIAPATQERLIGKQAHKKQMEQAKSAPPTSGSLHTPQSTGNQIYGGRLHS